MPAVTPAVLRRARDRLDGRTASRPPSGTDRPARRAAGALLLAVIVAGCAAAPPEAPPPDADTARLAVLDADGQPFRPAVLSIRQGEPVRLRVWRFPSHTLEKPSLVLSHDPDDPYEGAEVFPLAPLGVGSLRTFELTVERPGPARLTLTDRTLVTRECAPGQMCPTALSRLRWMDPGPPNPPGRPVTGWRGAPLREVGPGAPYEESIRLEVAPRDPPSAAPLWGGALAGALGAALVALVLRRRWRGAQDHPAPPVAAHPPAPD